MIKLSQYLGFGISSAYEFSHLQRPEMIDILEKLIVANYNSELPITNSERREVMDILLGFYAIHIDSFGEIKSIKILKTVLSTL